MKFSTNCLGTYQTTYNEISIERYAARVQTNWFRLWSSFKSILLVIRKPFPELKLSNPKSPQIETQPSAPVASLTGSALTWAMSGRCAGGWGAIWGRCWVDSRRSGNDGASGAVRDEVSSRGPVRPWSCLAIHHPKLV